MGSQQALSFCRAMQYQDFRPCHFVDVSATTNLQPGIAWCIVEPFGQQTRLESLVETDLRLPMVAIEI